jgi:hypothetical protein
MIVKGMFVKKGVANPGDTAPGGFPVRPAAWVVSALFHLVALVVVGWSFREAPPRGTGAEQTAVVGITLHPAPDAEPEVSSPDLPSGDAQELSSRTDSSAADVLAEVAAAGAESELAKLLPESPGAIAQQQIGQTGTFDPGPAAGNPALRSGTGGKARVRLFGIVGEGNKFVYVFDRSDSMNWFDRRPLRAAKAELLASLEGLGETHQFQIIFYNHEPLIFNPAGDPRRLAFATEANKDRARRFVQSVAASGGTRHMEAILLALSLQPEVIFLLTDADDPQLSDGQVATIARRAEGITIHTIEFGYGPQKRTDNFLVKLARLTGGQHVYVDISTL